MTPNLIALIVSMVEELVKIAPGVVSDIKNVLSKTDATPADWQAVKDAVLAKRYEDFVPDTQIGKPPTA